WDWYRRTAPSAGATYPLEVYVVIGEKGVRSGSGYLEAGVYRYNPFRHSLTLVRRGDARRELWEASWRQDWVRDAPVSIVICAVYERTTSRYGERGVRYVILEAGHVGQNIYLMATALNLGTVAIGAFDDAAVARAISARAGEAPLYVYPVGVPRELYRGSFDEVRRLIEGMRRG
ncbi:MAG: SagB/ThcOx family dehydrogenase, partial [Thermofilaceae archaeon]